MSKSKQQGRNKRTKSDAKKPNKLEQKPFEWTTEHQEALDTLNHDVVMALVLGYPDFTKDFILETDVSLKC